MALFILSHYGQVPMTGPTTLVDEVRQSLLTGLVLMLSDFEKVKISVYVFVPAGMLRLAVPGGE